VWHAIDLYFTHWPSNTQQHGPRLRKRAAYWRTQQQLRDSNRNWREKTTVHQQMFFKSIMWFAANHSLSILKHNGWICLTKNTSYKLHTTQLTVELDTDCIDVAFLLHMYTFCGPRVHLCVCVSVCRRRQITFQATLIFHLIDGLLSTTAAHEVRRAGVLTCGSYHLERSARPQKLRGWSCQVLEIAQIELF